jgi:hypothetical protein
MRPTPHTRTRNARIGDGALASAAFPVTDSAYQSVTLDGYRGGCVNRCTSSFRNISNDYFKTEARRSFVAEAVFFALIMVISSWPILLSIRAMTGLVRAGAAF